MADVLGSMKIEEILIACQGGYEIRLKGLLSTDQLVAHVLDDGF